MIVYADSGSVCETLQQNMGIILKRRVKKQMTERNHRLIDGKVMKYLLPSVMMTMAMQLGNIVDTILVGNLLGTEAMSAIRLAIPVMTIEQMPGYGLGAGAAVCVGILLGKRDKKRASDIFSAVLWLTVICGLLFSVCSFFLAYPIAGLLSGGSELTEMTGQYLFVWMLGGPIIGVGLYLINFMGLESRPQLSSAYIIVSNVVNLVLDYVFLAYTPLGTTGAALSTMIGYLVGLFVFIPYFTSKSRMLNVTSLRSFKPAAEAFKAGVPTLIYMGMSFVGSLGSNFIVIMLLGVDGVTIYTVCVNVMMITLMLTGGIIGIIPNLAGVLFGEKDYYGLRAVCVKTLKITAGATAAVLLAVLVSTEQIVELFGIKDSTLLELTIPAMRCFMICLPFYVWNKFLTSYYQCIGETKLASLITFLQYGAISLPATYICIVIGQMTGGSGFIAMGLAFPVAEGVTALVAFIFRKIKYRGSNVFILPAENSGECLDITVSANGNEAAVAAERIQEFANSHGVEASIANRMAVAAEEMIHNVIVYGGKSSEWIDICLNIEPDVLCLRIRDNGVPFDPTDYTFDGDAYDIGGIEIVRRISTNVSYVRVIDLNNTVIEINRSFKEENTDENN